METVEQVTAAIEHAGLAHLTETILPLVRPSVRITYGDTPADGLPVGASRIGGLPDLPPEFEWPAFSGSPDHSGGYYDAPGPQCLLAQINLADVAPHDPEGLLPRAGVLYFFAATWINAITDTDGEQGQEPWSVLFYDGDPARLSPRPLPPLPEELVNHENYQFNQGGNAPYGHVFTPVALRFTRELTLPALSHNDHWRGLLALTDDDRDRYDELRNRVSPDYPGEPPASHPPVHRMLGHVQPKQAFWDAAWEKTLLLQLDSNMWSEMPSDFQWEFCGRGLFLIDPAALAARDFSRIDLAYSV